MVFQSRQDARPTFCTFRRCAHENPLRRSCLPAGIRHPHGGALAVSHTFARAIGLTIPLRNAKPDSSRHADPDTHALADNDRRTQSGPGPEGD